MIHIKPQNDHLYRILLIFKSNDLRSNELLKWGIVRLR